MERHTYKVTFEDGSEYLAHYGVKGMRWGQHLFGNDIVGGLQRVAGDAASAIGGGIDKARSILFGEQNGGGGIDDEEKKNESTEEVEEEVEEVVTEERKTLSDEEVTELAYDVIRGDWGNGEERYENLSDAGYSYAQVQTKVNDIIYGTDDFNAGNNTSGRDDPEPKTKVVTTKRKVQKPVESSNSEEKKSKILG